MFSYRRHCGNAWAAFQCVPGFLVANHKVGLKCSHSQSSCFASSVWLPSSDLCTEAEAVSCRPVRVAKDKHWKRENVGEDGRNIQSLLMKTDTAVGFYTALWGRHTGSSQQWLTLLRMEVGKAWSTDAAFHVHLTPGSGVGSLHHPRLSAAMLPIGRATSAPQTQGRSKDTQASLKCAAEDWAVRSNLA